MLSVNTVSTGCKFSVQPVEYTVDSTYNIDDETDFIVDLEMWPMRHYSMQWSTHLDNTIHYVSKAVLKPTFVMCSLQGQNYHVIPFALRL